jgi:spermidine synthase
MAKKWKQSRCDSSRPAAASGPRLPVIMVLLFVSGFAGLVYQVLWMKQLGLLFGSTAQASAATLAAFFAGLGAGSWWWGRRTGASTNPLRLYAMLEFGIALTALVYFVILKVFYGIYPLVAEPMSGAAGMLFIKFALSLLLIFPPAFFMGGTVPAIGQALIRDRGKFGGMAALIYGTNTLGAALGVSFAAFQLIPSLGFRTTYGFAVLLSAAVGVVSWRLSCGPGIAESPVGRRDTGKRGVASPARGDDGEGEKGRSQGGMLDRSVIWALCFFSGFAVLALEVVWTRVFAQVHENSVYSFAIILTVVLLCLGLGAWIAAGLSRLGKPPMQIVGLLMVAGGALLVLGPTLLMHVTDDLQPVRSLESWDIHVRRVFKMGFGGIGFVVIALGTVFPFLMKAAERDAEMPGRTLGRLLAINTAGAIAGSLVCGFVLLPWLGMWGSIRLLTAGYLLVGLLVPIGWGRAGIVGRVAGVACLVLLFTALDPSRLPTHAPPSVAGSETVLKTWEGSDCTVAVVELASGHRAIRINGAYVLGSTAAYLEQANQSRIPLFVHPGTESICYIGMGTGMSAGAALAPRFSNVKRIVSCELVPEVVEAARDYIPEKLTRGVFSDPRSTVLVEDGRHFLMAADESFDMINADLFLPYRRGAGSLYSLDHYRTAAERLNPGGVYVQWLPLYQLTEYEFGVIARTMLEAFGQVTMWRNNFAPGKEKVALIGQRRASPLPLPPTGKEEVMLRAVEGMDWYETTPDMVRAEPEAIMFLYCGNVSAARSLFEAYPVNTDDRPVIEYQTPRTFREGGEKKRVIWFVGPKLAGMVDRIRGECPLGEDPMLQGHPDASRSLAAAGAAFHQAMIWKALGDADRSRAEWEVFKERWRVSVR